MKTFAALLDRLAFEPSRNGKLRLLADYFRRTPDPDRGYALAAMTGDLKFAQAKPALVRALIAERTDPVLFGLSYDYVGDLSETVALLWPAPAGVTGSPPGLAQVVDTLRTAGRQAVPNILADWLDRLDEGGRWALLKLITGALRVGVSARLAKTAIAAMGNLDPDEIEEVWHGLTPPYASLFTWVTGAGPRPQAWATLAFRTPMLAHALDPQELAGLEPRDFSAEWKWDGIRVQVVGARQGDGAPALRLYSRTGDDISAAFPDVISALAVPAFGASAIDGELLIVRDGRVQPFSDLQQRLNRKSVPARLAAAFPAHVRAYDILTDNGEDLRALPFEARRLRLAALVARAGVTVLDLSPQLPFATWDDIAALRENPGLLAGPEDAEAVEGLMLKRRDSAYMPGRPKGPWFKWKREPRHVDAVLMYAQRGHGKRGSFYSDFTFGVWRAGADGDELVPVGKAYFGFTDAELVELDRYVRNNTTNRFGPVREVAFGPDRGLVLEIAFEGLNRSTRHKSGVAMRFPRISRIRRDKPAGEADRLETLMALMGPAGVAAGQ